MQNKVLLCSALLSRSDYLAFSKNTIPSLQKVAAFASKSSSFYPLRRLFFGSAVQRFLIFSLHHKIYSFVLFSFQGTKRKLKIFVRKYLHTNISSLKETLLQTYPLLRGFAPFWSLIMT